MVSTAPTVTKFRVKIAMDNNTVYRPTLKLDI